MSILANGFEKSIRRAKGSTEARTGCRSARSISLLYGSGAMHYQGRSTQQLGLIMEVQALPANLISSWQ